MSLMTQNPDAYTTLISMAHAEYILSGLWTISAPYLQLLHPLAAACKLTL